MTNDEHDLFCKFLKIKPLVVQGAELEDVHVFLIDFFMFLHTMKIIKRYKMEFMTFQLQGEAKQFLVYVLLPSLTWS